jgi:hypothetical protein
MFIDQLVDYWFPNDCVSNLVLFVCFWLDSSPLGQGLLILEFSRSHSDAQQSVGLLRTSDQFVAETSNWQHSQQTNFHAAVGIRTHDLSRRAAADLGLRPRGHWDRQPRIVRVLINEVIVQDAWIYSQNYVLPDVRVSGACEWVLQWERYLSVSVSIAVLVLAQEIYIQIKEFSLQSVHLSRTIIINNVHVPRDSRYEMFN